MVHLNFSTTIVAEAIDDSGAKEILSEERGDIGREHHFCERCAEDYYASEFGSHRNLICLSDWYRDYLYDILEAEHSKVIYEGEDESQLIRASEVMRNVLRQQLEKEKIELNEEVFTMLLTDLIGSHHFYARRNAYKNKKAGDQS